jgi:histone H3/H4
MASLLIRDEIILGESEWRSMDMADVLVVTSKVKKFIKEKGGCNTSAETIDVLSKAVERLCQKGVDSAKADGRKTVMARDIVIDHL